MKDETMGKKRKTRRKMGKRRNRKSDDEERSLINVPPFEKLFVFLAHFSLRTAGRDLKSGKALKNMGSGRPTRTETIA
jgi:hypothetical protein